MIFTIFFFYFYRSLFDIIFEHSYKRIAVAKIEALLKHVIIDVFYFIDLPGICINYDVT